MSTTPDITLTEWNASKFRVLPISAAALNLINRSETLKADIRAYQAAETTDLVKQDANANAGSYTVPGQEKGFLSIGLNRLSTPESTVDILAHELGHFKVEGPNGAITLARAAATAASNSEALQGACHMTEGYGRYNEVKVRREIMQVDEDAAALEQRPLNNDELARARTWNQAPEEAIVKSMERLINQPDPTHPYTEEDAAKAAVYALGEDNQRNFTSTSGGTVTYAEACRRDANNVLQSGQNTATAPAESKLTTVFDEHGQVSESSTTTTVNNKTAESTKVFNDEGTITSSVSTVPTSGNQFQFTATQGGNVFTGTGTENSDGEAIVTAVTAINGQPPTNATQANAALQGNEITVDDLLNHPGRVLPIIEAVDPSNPTGIVTPPASALAGSGSINSIDDLWSLLSSQKSVTFTNDAVSLISAIRSGQPLAIATAGFNMASHNFEGNPTVAAVAAAFSGVGSLKGPVNALETGDLGRILIDGGGTARSAVTLYQRGIEAQINASFGSVAGARNAIDYTNDALAQSLIKDFDCAQSILETIGTAIAVLNIVNSLQEGDV